MQDNAGAPRRWLCRKLAAAPWAGTGSADLQQSAGGALSWELCVSRTLVLCADTELCGINR